VGILATVVAFEGLLGWMGMVVEGGNRKYLSVIAGSVDPPKLCRIPSREAVGLEMLVVTARYCKRLVEEAFWPTCWF
jgi:hypothetical protein